MNTKAIKKKPSLRTEIQFNNKRSLFPQSKKKKKKKTFSSLPSVERQPRLSAGRRLDDELLRTGCLHCTLDHIGPHELQHMGSRAKLYHELVGSLSFI